MQNEVKQLSEMPNIGKILAEKLQLVGIETPQDLLDIGSEQAFIRIKTVDSGACMSMLQALEGAVQGIRWHHLDTHRKLALHAFYKRLNSSPSQP